MEKNKWVMVYKCRNCGAVLESEKTFELKGGDEDVAVICAAVGNPNMHDELKARGAVGYNAHICGPGMVGHMEFIGLAKVQKSDEE